MAKGNKYSIAPGSFPEKKETENNTSGFVMDLQETFISGAGIRWGEYQNKAEHTITFYPKEESIVSHFQIYGNDTGKNKGLQEKQFVIYKESSQPYELTLNPTYGSKRRFFELTLSKSFYRKFLNEESNFLMLFDQGKHDNTFSSDFIAYTTPEMFRIMAEMQHTPYSGNLNNLFIESKITELFLTQISWLDNRASGNDRLKATDLERLVYVREYLDQHFADNLSVTAIARKAGINQTKLKSGFKQLFQTTLFGYISDLRLNEAKRLLLEEKLYVSEVADRVGYKYPHYFTAAFKKKFGIKPVCLKSC
ncbi:AraC-type DNA-binding protein [Pseudarcicella hirudinis]|uniref:AraC-type DNA-binding protein n=1 Tax=Pseudarcicella hirudinis TaxID=1079859 RepID=A0A1I5SL46_9BACT|nr:AraC family transcriptional regulator [Pseudarcicella hirudinis]SFP71524.1 AraC-type DNA-binding protein [Pseudarcicella hirudinis]